MDADFWFARLWLGRTAERWGGWTKRAAKSSEPTRRPARFPSARANRPEGHCRRPGGAQQVLAELATRAHPATSRRISPPLFVHAALGDRDAAFAALERGFELRTFFMTWLLIDPDLDPLRADPRFDALVKRVGLPQ